MKLLSLRAALIAMMGMGICTAQGVIPGAEKAQKGISSSLLGGSLLDAKGLMPSSREVRKNALAMAAEELNSEVAEKNLMVLFE